MKKLPNNKLIGLFTIISISIFFGIILIFIGDKIFAKKNSDELVMYFEESIRGLTIGSPVSFRGVKIGKVSKIDLIADANDMNFCIPVFVKLNENQNFIIQNHKKIRDKEKFFKNLIEKGLRARLSTQSYLTGQLMIELEMLPNTIAKLKNQNTFENTIEIPTILSPIEELSKNFQDLSIKDSIDKINLLFEMFNQKLPTILNQTTLIAKSINKITSNNIDGISTTLNNLNKTIIDIGETARSIKNFTDYLERHPEALLKGKGDY